MSPHLAVRARRSSGTGAGTSREVLPSTGDWHGKPESAIGPSGDPQVPQVPMGSLGNMGGNQRADARRSLMSKYELGKRVTIRRGGSPMTGIRTQKCHPTGAKPQVPKPQVPMEDLGDMGSVGLKRIGNWGTHIGSTDGLTPATRQDLSWSGDSPRASATNERPVSRRNRTLRDFAPRCRTSYSHSPLSAGGIARQAPRRI
jgi:hypothetical protein